MKSKRSYETLLTAVTAVYIAVMASLFIVQKMHFHETAVKANAVAVKLTALREQNKLLSLQVNMLGSSKRIASLAPRYGLSGMSEGDVMYLSVERPAPPLNAKKEGNIFSRMFTSLMTAPVAKANEIDTSAQYSYRDKRH